jgi:hypothetical protein
VKKTLSLLLAALIVSAATAVQGAAATPTAPVAAPGKMLIDANGGRLALVDRVDQDGSVEIIIDGRLVTVPAATLSVVGGRLVTSLKKPQVLALQ